MQFMTFRLQLAGLMTILLLCLNIEALPTKKQASNTIHKQQSLRTHSTGTAKQCALKQTNANHRSPTASGSKLHKRSTVSHPSAKSPMVLFHGTRTEENANSLAINVDLTKTHSSGDFHHNKKGADGGAYFTDSLAAAAQYACYSTKYDPTLALPSVVYVASFNWSPGSLKVHEFSTKVEVTDDKAKTFDMITGPMVAGFIDAYLTDDFWQYAVVKKEAVAGLKHIQNYKIYCAHVGEHNFLSKEEYVQGQYGNPGFAALAAKLTSPPESQC